MELILSFFLGSVLGLLYNEHIYRQVRRFPEGGILYSFWVRFLALFAFALVVALLYGPYSLLSFAFGNLIFRFLHTLFRSFIFVRYWDGSA